MYPHIRTFSRHKVKHFALAFALLLPACGENKPRENIQPPEPGVPSTREDVQGIYRTIHQGLLQLRGNGRFVLIVPEDPGASSGTYDIVDGRLTVTTNVCGPDVGEYDLNVTGEAEPGKALLNFVAVRDDCETRRRHLTLTPWVYAVS